MIDVIIVGAGPGGSTAARLLAQSGIQVMVFERESFPRIKPCGGGLTSRALKFLPDDYHQHLACEPTRWVFEGRDPHQFRAVSTATPYSHIVERQAFDEWLLSRAEAAGATIHTQEAVTGIKAEGQGYRVLTTRGSYWTRYLIGADGGRGVTARLLGFSRPSNGAAMEVEVLVSPEVFETWKDSVNISIGKYPWGYAWVIPRRPILNLGVGSFRAHRLPLRRLLIDWVNLKLGHEASQHLNILAHPLPYRLHSASLAKPRAVLVGDAAGMMDALSAEGIYSALFSATLAAETIREAAADDGSLLGYNQKLAQSLWPDLHAATKVGLIFYPLPQFWTKLFLANPSLIEQYLRVAQGKAPYSSLVAMGRRALLTKAHLYHGLNKGGPSL